MNIFFIVSIFCLAACFVMFLYFQWYIKRRTSSSGLDERKTEVVKLIAEIDRITDRDSQLVEDRVNRLKELLVDVDKRIALYEKEISELQHLQKKDISAEGLRTNETLYTSLGRGISAALKAPAEPGAQLSLEIPAPQTAATPPVQAVHPQDVHPEDVPEPEKKEQSVKPPSKKQIRAHIDILVNEGLSAEEIASRLEISIAEVNLAMNLRRGKSRIEKN